MYKPGTIHPKKSMFLRVHIGEAKAEDGSVYEMSTGMDGAPIIHSVKSGRWFSLSWQEIVNMAVEAEIDNEEPADAPKPSRAD